MIGKLLKGILSSGLVPWRKLKEIKYDENEGKYGVLKNADVLKTIIKFVFFWVTLITLLWAFHKGWITMSEVESIIETVKE